MEREWNTTLSPSLKAMEYPGSEANVFPQGSLTEDWRKGEDPLAIYSFLAEVNAEEEEEEGEEGEEKEGEEE